jgi:type IV pilus assembly protein PilB
MRLTGLARRLAVSGLLSEEDALAANDAAFKAKKPFVSYLVQNNLLPARELAIAGSHEFGVPLYDLDTFEISSEITRLVDEKLIRKHDALPIFRRGNRLFVAISDPTNLQALDEFKFHTGLLTEGILVEEDKLASTIEKSLEASDTLMSALGDDDIDGLELTAEEEDQGPEVSASDADDTPVVRFVNKVLLDAIRKKASDIHFEPYEKAYRVRLRLDGMLEEVAAPPVSLAPRITARLKVLSRLDISERRVPQDGRMKMSLSKNRSIDFRVNTLPTLFGEKVVLRILDSSSAKLGIDALGFEPEQRQRYLEALAKPYGLILVTGPTGSG